MVTSSLKHTLHGTHYHLTRSKELKKLFTAHSIASIANSFIAIFIPVYLLKTGYQVMDLVVFYFFIGFFKLILSPFSFKAISRFGGNHTMTIGMVGEIIAFLLLATLPVYDWPLVLISFFKGMHGIFYYPAFHVNFSLSRAHKKTGRTVGFMNILMIIVGVFAPAVGGFVATRYGINWLYGSAMVLFLLTSIMLMTAGELKTPSFSLRRIPIKVPIRDYAANFAQNFAGLSDIFAWTLLVFFIIPSYVGIGIVSSLGALSSLLITLYVSKREDIGSEKPYINAGSLFATIADILRVLVVTPLQVVGVNFLSGISATLLSNAFVSRYYRNSDKGNRLEYMFAMEASNSLAWLVFFSGLFILGLYFSAQTILMVGVLSAIPATIAIRLMR